MGLADGGDDQSDRDEQVGGQQPAQTDEGGAAGGPVRSRAEVRGVQPLTPSGWRSDAGTAAVEPVTLAAGGRVRPASRRIFWPAAEYR